MKSLKIIGVGFLTTTSFLVNAQQYYNGPMDRQSAEQAVAVSEQEKQAQKEAQARVQQTTTANSGATQRPAGQSETERCELEINTYNTQKSANPALAKSSDVEECEVLKVLADNKLKKVQADESKVQSVDKKIQCIKREAFTVDYSACESAINYYNFVINAETAMDLQQKIRTDMKNQSIQKNANQKVLAGDTQTGMFDASIESNNHQKNMQQEKMVAYGSAVAALVAAYRMIPTSADTKQKYCTNGKMNTQLCATTIDSYKRSVLSNQDAKAALATAIATFTAKGLQAGIAMGQYGNAAKQVEAAKKTVANEGDDLMVDRCAFNPADPACVAVTPGSNNGSISPGSFQMDPTVGNNSFNLTPDTETTTDPLTDPTKDENAPVASVNSPFVDEAERARDIINPAGAAQMQAGTDPSGGSPGGGGAPGGGSAQVGNDLNGADKDGNKEASIKPNEVSGTYAQGGGGGYKALARGKDDANPFSSLFDAKSDGGIEEDRSIASEDIDGASSGLFQKISRRYGQVQADKRIEAKNLE